MATVPTLTMEVDEVKFPDDLGQGSEVVDEATVNPFRFINENTEQRQSDDIIQSIKQEPDTEDEPVTTSDMTSFCFGLTEEIKVDKTGQVLHYKFNNDDYTIASTSSNIESQSKDAGSSGDEAPSGGEDRSDRSSTRGQCGSDYKEDDDFADVLNIKQETETEEPGTVNESGRRSRRACAIAARKKLKMINNLVENNPKIAARKKRKNSSDEWSNSERSHNTHQRKTPRKTRVKQMGKVAMEMSDDSREEGEVRTKLRKKSTKSSMVQRKLKAQKMLDDHTYVRNRRGPAGSTLPGNQKKTSKETEDQEAPAAGAGEERHETSLIVVDQNINYLRAFLRNVGICDEISDIVPRELNLLLLRFFKQMEEDLLWQNAQRDVFASLQMYLLARSYPADINTSPVFKGARGNLNPSGLFALSKNTVINTESVLSAKNFLKLDTAKTVLLSLVWMNSQYFGLSSWEEHHALKFGDIHLVSNAEGEEVLELVKVTRSSSGDAPGRVTRKRIRSTSNKPDDPGNPLVVYKYYTKRRPAEMIERHSPFYLTPSSSSKHFYLPEGLSIVNLKSIFLTYRGLMTKLQQGSTQRRSATSSTIRSPRPGAAIGSRGVGKRPRTAMLRTTNRTKPWLSKREQKEQYFRNIYKKKLEYSRKKSSDELGHKMKPGPVGGSRVGVPPGGTGGSMMWQTFKRDGQIETVVHAMPTQPGLPSRLQQKTEIHKMRSLITGQAKVTLKPVLSAAHQGAAGKPVVLLPWTPVTAPPGVQSLPTPTGQFVNWRAPHTVLPQPIAVTGTQPITVTQPVSAAGPKPITVTQSIAAMGPFTGPQPVAIRPQPITVTGPQPIIFTGPQPITVTRQQPITLTGPQPITVTRQQPITVTRQQPFTFTGPQPITVTRQQPITITQPITVTAPQPIAVTGPEQEPIIVHDIKPVEDETSQETDLGLIISEVTGDCGTFPDLDIDKPRSWPDGAHQDVDMIHKDPIEIKPIEDPEEDNFDDNIPNCLHQTTEVTLDAGTPLETDVLFDQQGAPLATASSSHETYEGRPCITISSDDSDAGNSPEEQKQEFFPVSLHVCKTCGKSLLDAAALRRHLRVMHLEGLMKCDQCKIRLPKEEFPFHKCPTLPKYQSKKTTVKLYGCLFCGSRFSNYRIWNSHMTLRHQNNLNRCKICGKVFISTSLLKRHLRRNHPTQLKDNFVNTPWSPERKHDEGYDNYPPRDRTPNVKRSVVRCSLCPKCFMNLETLAKHKERVHGVVDKGGLSSSRERSPSPLSGRPVGLSTFGGTTVINIPTYSETEGTRYGDYNKDDDELHKDDDINDNSDEYDYQNYLGAQPGGHLTKATSAAAAVTRTSFSPVNVDSEGSNDSTGKIVPRSRLSSSDDNEPQDDDNFAHQDQNDMINEQWHAGRIVGRSCSGSSDDEVGHDDGDIIQTFTPEEVTNIIPRSNLLGFQDENSCEGPSSVFESNDLGTVVPRIRSSGSEDEGESGQGQKTWSEVMGSKVTGSEDNNLCQTCGRQFKSARNLFIHKTNSNH